MLKVLNANGAFAVRRQDYFDAIPSSYFDNGVLNRCVVSDLTQTVGYSNNVGRTMMPCLLKNSVIWSHRHERCLLAEEHFLVIDC